MLCLMTLSCATSWARNSRSAARLASRGFERTVPAAPLAEGPPRDLVVLCHDVGEAVFSGSFKLDNLPNGRVDLLARCASSAVFLSHGVRPTTRLWLQLGPHDVALCLDGRCVRGMHPDERTLAAAMKRTLRVAHGGAKPRDDTRNGWSVHRGGLEALLSRLTTPADTEARPRPLVLLHEEADASLDACLAATDDATRTAADGAAADAADAVDAADGADADANAADGWPGAVLVLGDQLGCTAAEEATIARLGGRRATCSPRGLLTSHCIVLAHHALDVRDARHAASRGGAATLMEGGVS